MITLAYRRDHYNKVRIYAAQAMVMAGFVSTTCDGLKAIAKVAKSGSEAIKYIHETYDKTPSDGLISVNNIASNFTGIFNIFEPLVIVQDLVFGDKEGKKPWEYFQGKTYPKGAMWVFKRTKSATKFAKFLHSMQVVNLARMLGPFATLKLVCDLAQCIISLIDRSIVLKSSLDSSAKLERRLVKWEARKADGYAEENVCTDKIQSINDRIKSEETVRKKCGFKIACKIALLALTIFCIIALVVQWPWLNFALLALGFAFNLVGVYKFVTTLLQKKDAPVEKG